MAERVSPRIAHVDALRAAAVMLVVVMHAGLTIVPGDGGVVVFFTVSGYIITSLVVRERERTGGFAIGSFYVRRLVKLVPPLLVLVVLPSLVWALFRPLSWWALAGQVGFVYNWQKLIDYQRSLEVLPGSEVVWSLAIEEQFYIGFALLWIVLCRVWRGRSAHVALAATAAAAILWSLATRVALAWGQPRDLDDWDGQRLQHLFRGTDARLEAIAIGVLVAVAHEAHRRGRLPWLARAGSDVVLVGAAVAFALASLVLRDGMGEAVLRPSVQAWVAAAVVLYGALPGRGEASVVRSSFHRVCGWRPVQAVGLASYSIYLGHGPAMHVVDAIAGDLPAPVPFVLLVVAGTGVGVVTYHLVEVPALRLKQRWAPSPATVSSPTPTTAPG
ncbi:acyltransferase family protein [Nocardioides litoris]|uniref:acyltransferase family protein n=1 Tax=Nocardioides litoris TaxID=1926648 RepID=UPI0014776A20|nr:acyltransferase [Nocardioides litoris]